MMIIIIIIIIIILLLLFFNHMKPYVKMKKSRRFRMGSSTHVQEILYNFPTNLSNGFFINNVSKPIFENVSALRNIIKMSLIYYF